MKIRHRQLTAALLAAAVIGTGAGGSLPAYGAEASVATDETMYVNLDYYGRPAKINVVKGCSLNGKQTFIDYGDYLSVDNMTGPEQPELGDGSVTWNLPEGRTGRFYYKCAMDTKTVELPWNFDVSYKLNGVPMDGEKLAGASGLVEIHVKAVPNEKAALYYRNNMLLVVAVPVDLSTCYSVEAEGSQTQNMGETTAVVFTALPGEEGDYKVRMGTDSFETTGVLMTMMPGTMEDLEHIKDLKEAKDTWRDAGDQLYDSLEQMAESVEAMREGVNQAKSGAASAERARQKWSGAKDSILAGNDEALNALTALSQQMEAMVPHIQTAKETSEILHNSMNDIVATMGEMQEPLRKLHTRLRNIESSADAIADELPDIQKEMETLMALDARFQANEQAILTALKDLPDTLQEIDMDYYDLELEADKPKKSGSQSSGSSGTAAGAAGDQAGGSSGAGGNQAGGSSGAGGNQEGGSSAAGGNQAGGSSGAGENQEGGSSGAGGNQAGGSSGTGGNRPDGSTGTTGGQEGESTGATGSAGSQPTEGTQDKADGGAGSSSSSENTAGSSSADPGQGGTSGSENNSAESSGQSTASDSGSSQDTSQDNSSSASSDGSQTEGTPLASIIRKEAPLVGDPTDMTLTASELLALLQKRKGTLEEISKTSRSLTVLMSNLMDNTADSAKYSRELIDNLDYLIEDITALNDSLDVYYPDLQEALDDSKELVDRTTEALNSGISTMTIVQNTLRATSEDADAAARDSLGASLELLDKSLSILDSTTAMRQAGRTMKDTVDSQLDKFDTENRFLFMDPSEKKVSFTSSENEEPNTLQIVLRTDEISLDSEENKLLDAEGEKENVSPLRRMWNVLVQMWQAIISIFKNR